MSLQRRDPAEGWSDRRAWERVEYTSGPRPRLRLRLGGFPSSWYEVLDCSERGVRVVGQLPAGAAAGIDASGILRFPHGAEAVVEGVVVRVESGGFALHFTTRWLEREIIRHEQRRLRGASTAR